MYLCKSMCLSNLVCVLLRVPMVARWSSRTPAACCPLLTLAKIPKL